MYAEVLNKLIPDFATWVKASLYLAGLARESPQFASYIFNCNNEKCKDQHGQFLTRTLSRQQAVDNTNIGLMDPTSICGIMRE